MVNVVFNGGGGGHRQLPFNVIPIQRRGNSSFPLPFPCSRYETGRKWLVTRMWTPCQAVNKNYKYSIFYMCQSKLRVLSLLCVSWRDPQIPFMFGILVLVELLPTFGCWYVLLDQNVLWEPISILFLHAGPFFYQATLGAQSLVIFDIGMKC